MNRIEIIRTEAERLATVLAEADPEARVPTCPEWNAADLLWHLTEVHLFWAGILADGALTDEDSTAVEERKPARPATVAEMLPVRAQATASLLAELSRLDDGEPRWTWFPPDQTVGFTRRMQTYEATFHRIDAELAAGVPVSPVAADVAAGAVDHAVDAMYGWMPEWATYEPLTTVALEATDTGRVWELEVGHWTGTGPESGKAFDEPRAVRGAGGTPDVTVRAGAEQLALWLWVRGGTAEVEGTPEGRAALDRLLANGIQ